MGSVSPDGIETESETERNAAAIKRMANLQNEIETLAKDSFPGLRVAIESSCVMDELPSAGVMPAVKRALGKLAESLGIRA
jgi:hypothetical protein